MMIKPTLSITHAAGEYPIFIGTDLLSNKKLLASFIVGTQVCIVTDENIAPHYLSLVRTAFADFQCDVLILPPGETQKTLKTAEKIVDLCAQQRHHRDTTLIALGGGVIGDVTGFSASCYHRGVHLLQIPTTLLAQVDASIGGKTAVNHVLGKNLIGTFHAPHAVFMDIATLNTLPDREFRSGISEIIKVALVNDAIFFDWLEKNMLALLNRDTEILTLAIQRACEIKRVIVMQDEKEKNKRALLNLGHTFAHAIEATLGFGVWLHGEAVALGIVVAATLSHALNLLSDTDYHRIQHIFTQHHLLKKIPNTISAINLTECMQNDKKVSSNRLRLILLTAIGKAIITDQFSTEMIIAAWKKND